MESSGLPHGYAQDRDYWRPKVKEELSNPGLHGKCPLKWCVQDLVQGAYKSGKPGDLREFCKSGKLREFEMYSGNFGSPLLSATKM